MISACRNCPSPQEILGIALMYLSAVGASNACCKSPPISHAIVSGILVHIVSACHSSDALVDASKEFPRESTICQHYLYGLLRVQIVCQSMLIW